GLLQVAVLRDPTTGGVFASHVNLADVVFAQPGATIGFAGPRVAEAMTEGPLPEGSHTAEGARAAGLVDEVVPLEALPEVLGRLLAWPGATEPRPVAAPDGHVGESRGAWEEVQRARDPGRPTADAYLDRVDVAAELRGDRSGDDDPTIRVALARIEGRPVVLVAMDRRRAKGRVTPGGYRKAWRGLRLADRMGVPVVTLVDTPGADASAASEAGGIAHHISATFAEVLAVRTPVVAVTIGEGGSGGALALAVGDRLLIQEHAVFGVIGPEGAAAILHRDASRAAEVAELLKPTARELERLGIADEVVPEPAGGEVDAVLSAVCRHLDELAGAAPEQRLSARLDRWRGVARPSDAPESAATGAAP
ncbi:MAG: carboxyl transferase domain-containing protein, partial [Nitriliruptorales bacterium]